MQVPAKEVQVIKVMLVDLDGCLTDGNYQISIDGKLSKNFFTRDWAGLMMLNNAGVKTGIATYAEDGVLDQKIKQIPWAGDVVVLKTTTDKLGRVAEYFAWEFTRGYLTWDEFAFIGDDVGDIPLLRKVGLPACPVDADPVVIDCVSKLQDGIVLSCRGGHGAVRELANHVLRLNHAGDPVALFRRADVSETKH